MGSVPILMNEYRLRMVMPGPLLSKPVVCCYNLTDSFYAVHCHREAPGNGADRQAIWMP
jgi:hypothetical protein